MPVVAMHEVEVHSGNDQIYNAFDAGVTHEVMSTLGWQRKSAEPAYSFELAMQGPVLEMMLRGFRVNPGARELAIQSVNKDLARLDHILQTLVNSVWGKEINPNSGVQLKDFFYNHLGIRPITVWVKGELKEPMDRSVLERIEDYFQARPIVRTILDHRDLEKQLQVLTKEVDPDWRMRTSYNIGGTKSARFSSSKSPTGTGDNLQNVAEHLRHVFIPDPGYILCGIDAEQSDSRMVGFMCGVLFGDWSYLDACESGDLHTSVAKMVWPELPWINEPKGDREVAERTFYRHHSYRNACKHLGHGTNFLGKGPTMSKQTGVPIKLVKEFAERYFERFPCIPRLQAWVAEHIQRDKRLVSIHGRARDFFDRPDDDATVRKGMAFLAASATADNLNLGMWRIWKHMPEVQLLAQVHDAIYFQFREDLDRAAVLQKAQSLLITKLHCGNKVFSVPTDAKLGYNWGNYIPPDPETGTPEQNIKGLRKPSYYVRLD